MLILDLQTPMHQSGGWDSTTMHRKELTLLAASVPENLAPLKKLRNGSDSMSNLRIPYITEKLM